MGDLGRPRLVGVPPEKLVDALKKQMNHVMEAAPTDLQTLGFRNFDGLVADVAVSMPDWTVTLLNSWADVGGGVPATSVALTPDRLGCLKGYVSGGALNTNVLLLPEGLWPDGNELHAISSNGAFGELKIFTTGAVQISQGATTAVFMQAKWRVTGTYAPFPLYVEVDRRPLYVQILRVTESDTGLPFDGAVGLRWAPTTRNGVSCVKLLGIDGLTHNRRYRVTLAVFFS